MADYLTNAYKGRLAGDTAQISTNIDPGNDTFKYMLLDSTHSPDKDAEVYIDHVSANEVSASGTYSAGGLAVSITGSTDDTNDLGKLDAADISATSATITARYGVLYKDTGTPGTSPIILVHDFGSDKTAVGGTFPITFSTSGIITFS